MVDLGQPTLLVETYPPPPTWLPHGAGRNEGEEANKEGALPLNDLGCVAQTHTRGLSLPLFSWGPWGSPLSHEPQRCRGDGGVEGAIGSADSAQRRFSFLNLVKPATPRG